MNLLIEQAVLVLQNGGLVGLPTETVYGLAADATNPVALQKVFAAKKRPQNHPLIMHLGDSNDCHHYARDIPDDALLLAQTFWPGPLTLILKKKSAVLSIVTGGQETVGLRVPNHPMALAVLKKFGKPLAAPSANQYGCLSPTTAQAVAAELGNKVDLILDGGPCDIGVESTIVDFSAGTPRILRPGMILAEQLEEVLQKKLSQEEKDKPQVSGSDIKHYSPNTPVFLVDAAELQQLLQSNVEEKLGVLSLGNFPASSSVVNLRLGTDPIIYAKNLYAGLRFLDSEGLARIYLEKPPIEGKWLGIWDRLRKASVTT